MRKFSPVLSLCVSATLLASLSVGCGQKGEEQSSLKVTNGRSILETEYPSVVLLVSFSNEGESICTGTFVNDSQLITAAHCVEGLDSQQPKLAYVKEVNGELSLAAVAQNFVRHPEYNFADGVNPKDVAVVNFPANSAPAVSKIAAATPALDETLTIVGFGNNENFIDDAGRQTGSGAGYKRVGTNTVLNVTDGMIGFVGVGGKTEGVVEGELVSSGSGDSGGPLFVKDELAGVTSGGGFRPTEFGLVSVSLYVDLNSESVKSFLNANLKSAAAPATTVPAR